MSNHKRQLPAEEHKVAYECDDCGTPVPNGRTQFENDCPNPHCPSRRGWRP